MAVNTTDIKQQFILNGVLTEFNFTFKAISDTDIKCQTITPSGVTTDLTYTTDYTVEITEDGGVVTLADAGTPNHFLLVYRDTENLQETDYEDYNQFPADTVENDLDIRTLRSQEVKDALDRIAKLPISSTHSNIYLPTPSSRRALVWNTAEDSLINSTYDPDSQVDNASSYATIALGHSNNASTYATTALGYSDDASSHATTALGYANNASDSATASASSATVAQEAADSIHTVGTITITTKATIALANIVLATIGTLTITTKATIALLEATTATIGTLSMTGALTIEPDTDTLTALVVNDTDSNRVLTVDTINNRVGIGTTGPGAKLQINADKNAFSQILYSSLASGGDYTGTGFHSGFANKAAIVFATDGTIYKPGYLAFWVDDVGDANDVTASEERMRINKAGSVLIGTTTDTSISGAKLRVNGGIDVAGTGTSYIAGNVGIGTTEPGYILDIYHSASEYGGLINIENARASGGSVSGFNIKANGTSMNAGVLMYDANTTAGVNFAGRGALLAGYGTNGLNIMARGSTNSDIRFFTWSEGSTDTEQVRITRSGNVGIGVTDPDVKLEVFGSTGLKISFDATDNTTLVTDTAGNMTISPSGTEVGVAGDIKAVGTGATGIILYDTTLEGYYRITLDNGSLVITAI